MWWAIYLWPALPVTPAASLMTSAARTLRLSALPERLMLLPRHYCHCLKVRMVIHQSLYICMNVNLCWCTWNWNYVTGQVIHQWCSKQDQSVCVLVNIMVHFFSLAGESCSGRCGESFRRGRLCDCDPGCVRYDTCCRDYQNHCGMNKNYLYERTNYRISTLYHDILS